MRSIEAKFIKSEVRGPQLGAYIHLAKAVSYQGFSRKNIVKAFKKLMPEDEFLKNETSVLIDNLETLTNKPVEVEISPK